MKTWEEISALVNYDESKVPAYTLPDALLKADGSQVKNAYEWVNFQRPKILGLYRSGLYGETLPRPDEARFEVISEKKDALGGKALRREIRCSFATASGRKLRFDILLYVPRGAAGRGRRLADLRAVSMPTGHTRHRRQRPSVHRFAACSL